MNMMILVVVAVMMVMMLLLRMRHLVRRLHYCYWKGFQA
jgi:hypothetical protein